MRMCEHSRLYQHTCQLPSHKVSSTSMTEEKLDAKLKSVEVLKQEQLDGQRDLRKRLDHLEKEVSSGQEEATQRVVK